MPCHTLFCPILPLPSPCPALHYQALPCPAMPCPALPCRAVPCRAVPCSALPCPPLRHTPFVPAFRLALALTIYFLPPFAVLSDLPLPWPPSYRRYAIPLALPCHAPAYPALPCPILSRPAYALPSLALSCPALLCPVLFCPALPCPALPCHALPCPALPSLRCVTHHSSPLSASPWQLPSTFFRPLPYPPTCPYPALHHIVCYAIPLDCNYSCNTNRFVLPLTLLLAWPAVPFTQPVA